MKITTRQLAQTALLLALCIASQFLKNLSVYITGPIVNTIIILATLSVGLYSGLFISILSPITAFFIAASPIMAGIPLLIPTIMIGNCILAVSTWFFQKRFKFQFHLPIGLIIGSILKAAFLGALVTFILLPLFQNNITPHLPNPDALPKVIATAKITFSLTQLITALTGSLLAYLIWLPLQKFLKAENNQNN